MTVMAKEITRADILDMADYAKVRAEKRRALVETKRNRRVPLGPYATFYFERYEKMWQQVPEMLFIERGGWAQHPDALEAYNPPVPQGRDLVGTRKFGNTNTGH